MALKRLKFRTDKESFLSNTIPEPNTGCYIWLGHQLPNGYGKASLTIEGKPIRLAHRISWILHNGTIPNGEFVLHKCDNRICVNPDHLFLGSAKDNTQDMLSKFRMAYGESHGNTTLTTEEINNIRELYKTGKYSQDAIGKIYNISQSGISQIVRFKNRKFE